MAKRSPARRRTFPKVRRIERPFGMGPQVKDQVSGVPIPLSLAVRQRGGWVSRDWRDNTRDRGDDY